MLSTPEKRLPIYVPFLCYAFLLLAQWPTGHLITSVSMTLGILINEYLIVAGIPLLIFFYWKMPMTKLLPLAKGDRKSLFWTLLMTLFLIILIEYLTFLSERIFAPPPEIKSMLEKIMTVQRLDEGVWRWFLLCVTPAFCEEIFFRGFFQGTLQNHWGKKSAWILTAAAFALIHGIPAYWHLYFILGLFFGWLQLVRKNLLFPIFAHLINNSWTYLTHVVDYVIPRQESWQSLDSLVMAVCLVIFFLTVKRFQKTLAQRVKRSP